MCAGYTALSEPSPATGKPKDDLDENDLVPSVLKSDLTDTHGALNLRRVPGLLRAFPAAMDRTRRVEQTVWCRVNVLMGEPDDRHVR